MKKKIKKLNQGCEQNYQGQLSNGKWFKGTYKEFKKAQRQIEREEMKARDEELDRIFAKYGVKLVHNQKKGCCVITSNGFPKINKKEK